MSEWWTYRPDDFLLFSGEVYWRLFERTNAALWPLPLLALAAGLAVLALMAWRSRPGMRAAALLLALAWAVSGWGFVWLRYAPINWASAYALPLFALEALLLAGLALSGRRLGTRDGPARAIGLGLVVLAAIAVPLIAPLAGRPVLGAEIFAMAPDPTAIATLGIAAAMQGRLRWLVATAPILWLAASAATLFTLGAAQAWVVAAALGAALVGLALPTPRRGRL